MSRLKDRYVAEVVPALRKEFGYTNVMAVPKITKVVVNMGLGEGHAEREDRRHRRRGARRRSPARRRRSRESKKSIAQFKLRKNMPIGAMVTLRGQRMYEFLDRLIAIALPRVRDFRGVSRARVRRPRQLHAGPARPADLPGDRLPQGGQGARHEHLGRDDGQDRRRSAAAAPADGHAVQAELGEPKAEGRGFGSTNEGTYGDDREDCEGPRRRRSSASGAATAAASAAGRGRICGSSRSAASASVSWRCAAKWPA